MGSSICYTPGKRVCSGWGLPLSHRGGALSRGFLLRTPRGCVALWLRLGSVIYPLSCPCPQSSSLTAGWRWWWRWAVSCLLVTLGDHTQTQFTTHVLGSKEGHALGHLAREVEQVPQLQWSPILLVHVWCGEKSHGSPSTPLPLSAHPPVAFLLCLSPTCIPVLPYLVQRRSHLKKK